jgi:hypothetical protein
MIMQKRLTGNPTGLVLITAVVLIVFQPSAMALSTMECRSELIKWKREKPHKAFVVGRRMDYEYCGWMSAAASKQAAIKAATDACKKIGAQECTVHAAE